MNQQRIIFHRPASWQYASPLEAGSVLRPIRNLDLEDYYRKFKAFQSTLTDIQPAITPAYVLLTRYEIDVLKYKVPLAKYRVQLAKRQADLAKYAVQIFGYSKKISVQVAIITVDCLTVLANVSWAIGRSAKRTVLIWVLPLRTAPLRIKLTYGVATALITFGLIGTVPFLYFNQRNKHVLSTSNSIAAIVTPKPSPSPTAALANGQPSRLVLPALGTSLAIIDGNYDANNGTWTLTNDKVQFATISNLPNNLSGNTYLYGHNRANVFANLEKLQPGDVAVVETTNGWRFSYIYRSTKALDPTDASAFVYPAGDLPSLTLQTCSGAWYQNRQLYYFDLQKFEKL